MAAAGACVVGGGRSRWRSAMGKQSDRTWIKMVAPSHLPAACHAPQAAAADERGGKSRALRTGRGKCRPKTLHHLSEESIGPIDCNAGAQNS